MTLTQQVTPQPVTKAPPRNIQHVLFGNRYLNDKGYYRISGGTHAGWYLHRAIYVYCTGRPIPEGFHVHHHDFVRTHNCFSNLILIQAELHPAREHPRCPYTGRFLTRREIESLRSECEEFPF